MYLVTLLLLAVSVFYLGCALWIGYRDLYPFRPDETTVSTPPDEELPLFDQVNLGHAGAWSFLLHAGIIAVLLLVIDIPPGIGRFPARDRMATAKDFYVFMASLPEEEKHPPKASHSDNLRSPLQAAIPTLPVPTATRVAGLTMTKPPVPPEPAAVSVASAGDSTNGGPPTEKVAEKRRAPAPLVHDAASRELPTAPKRVVELFAVRALRPSPERLVPAAPLLSFVQDAEPAPPRVQWGATSQAPKVAPDPAPLPVPDGPAVATQLLDEGSVVAEPVEEATALPPRPKVSPLTPDEKSLPERGPSSHATLRQPEEAPFDHLMEARPPSQAVPESPPVPTLGDPAVAAQPLDAGPALFPSPGTVLARAPAPSSLVASVASYPPTPEPKAVPEGNRSVELQAAKALPVSPIQEATPLPPIPELSPQAPEVRPAPSPPSDPTLGEHEDVLDTRFVSASAAPEAGPDPPSVPVPDGPTAAAQPLDAGPVGLPSPGMVIAAGRNAPDRIPPGSPAGRGFGRLAVRLDGPRSRVTDHEIEAVSGKILGGVPVQLALYVNGMEREVVAAAGSFEVSVSLRRGLNHLRAVAKDWRGIETEDTIAVKYVPPPVPNGIAITSPRDGYTLPPDAPPVIVVEGQVEDWDVSTVWLVANDRRIAVRAHDGRFRKALPLLDPVIHVWAELPPNGKPPQRSQGVTVHAGSASPSHGLLLVDWPQGVASDQVKVKATWRAHPGRLDVPIRTVPLRAFGASTRDSLPEIFTLRMKPGVYTFLLRARAVSTGDVRSILYLPEAGHLKARELRMVSLNGTGEVVLAKILFPQGVLWEQDEWFTGQSESADTVTKFRFPEGISWTERKADL
ncbi:MAG: hypothetical protein IH782_06980 [candidate division NC10 bacterium]|nr:hypothetical protein [candidate division NC10 bacterium]